MLIKQIRKEYKDRRVKYTIKKKRLNTLQNVTVDYFSTLHTKLNKTYFTRRGVTRMFFLHLLTITNGTRDITHTQVFYPKFTN